VTALAYRYGDGTPVTMVTSAPDPATLSAGSRVVSLVDGRAGEVTTAVSADSGVPTLTLTGTGDELVSAARALSSDTLGVAGGDAENLSAQPMTRPTASKRSLGSLGTKTLALTGYGSTTQQLEVKQDDFGGPVKAMKLHLEGNHTAFAENAGARLDVRVNGTLVGSTTLGSESAFSLDATVPAGRLRSVNEVDLVMTAAAPDGSLCTPASVPAAELDVDTGASYVSVTKGFGQTEGFQLYPQAFEGTVPVALKPGNGNRSTPATNAAAILASLQRAASTPLEVQVVAQDTFLADKRDGMFIGALNGESTSLDAPLKLSATRELKKVDGTISSTSQEPFAALESVDAKDRLVLMLGSWAPGNGSAQGAVVKSAVGYVTTTGWAGLTGDLVLADGVNPPYATTSNSLAPHQVAEKDTSYAKWFIVVIAALLLLLLLQVVISIRRDRRVAGGEDDEGPAYVEDEEYVEDELGDYDDLDVLEPTENVEEPEDERR
jgi:hypothetical protein